MTTHYQVHATLGSAVMVFGIEAQDEQHAEWEAQKFIPEGDWVCTITPVPPKKERTKPEEREEKYDGD